MLHFGLREGEFRSVDKSLTGNVLHFYKSKSTGDVLESVTITEE